MNILDIGLRKQPVEDPDGRRRRQRGGNAAVASKGRVTIGIVTQIAGGGDLAGVMGLLVLQQPADGGPNAANSVKLAVGDGIGTVRFYLRNAANVVVAGPSDVQPVNREATWNFNNPGGTGNDFTVLAEDAGNPSINTTSMAFDVVPAQSISFTQQPSSGIQGALQTVTVGTSGVSVVKFTLFNSSNAPVSGPATVNVLSNQASWQITNPSVGTGYYVRAEDNADGSPTVTSNAFNTTINQSLTMEQQPQGGPAGSTGNVSVSVSGITQVVFRLRDLSDNLISQGTVEVVGGIAAWNFTMPAAGTYRINAADAADGTPNTTSANFTSTAPQAITFTQQPSSGTAGDNFTTTVSATSLTAVIFRLRDSANNVLASSGSVAVSGGQASWTRARPTAGVGYFVSAEDAADGSPLVNSAAFDSLLAESITITTQPANGTVGATGTVAVSATALANVRFTLKAANNSNAAAPVTVAVSGGTATHNFTYPSAASGYFFLIDDPVDGAPFRNSTTFSTTAAGDPTDPAVTPAVEWADTDGDYMILPNGDYIILS